MSNSKIVLVLKNNIDIDFENLEVLLFVYKEYLEKSYKNIFFFCK